MKRPDSVWEMQYNHDRRKHRHKCISCNKILNIGENVIMCRISQKKTYVAHLECSEKQHLPDSVETVREIMTIWGLIYLKSCGWKVPELD